MTEDPPLKRLAFYSAAYRAIALLGFLLPWLRVEVGGREVIRSTGLDLALGHVVLRVPIVGTVEGQGPIALPLVAAGILIIAGLALLFLADPRKRARLGLILSLIALGLIAGFVGYAIYVHLPVPPEQMSLIERLADAIVRKAVEARPSFGFTVTILMLGIGTTFDSNVLRATAPSSQSD